jgi:Kef-type K+ transport system membrane component KefB
LNGTYEFLITMGGLLLLGLATDMLGKRTSLPRVSLLIVFGAIIGPSALDLVPAFFLNQFQIVAQMALVMVGFLLGSKFTRESIAENGRAILSVSIIGAVVTGIAVLTGLLIFGVDLSLAIILACIATATDGIATVDVILETETDSPFSRLLYACVALDDGWGLIMFSIGLALVTAITAPEGDISPWVFTFHELGGAIMLGIVIGLPASYLTGHIKAGQPMRSEALGLVFLCGGLALWLEVSFLIATMVMGMMIANFAKHHEYPFNEIEGMEWPVLSIFFVLAGASLEFVSLKTIGILGLAYIGWRIVGKILGGWIGGTLGKCPPLVRRWLGLAMLPHAGAALGMALVASEYFPEYGDVLLSVIICATIVFEIVGPILSRLALLRTAPRQQTDGVETPR